MTKTEFYAYKQHTFDAFSKAIIRNESASIFRTMKRRSRRELSFSEVSEETLMSFQTTDILKPLFSMYEAIAFQSRTGR